MSNNDECNNDNPGPRPLPYHEPNAVRSLVFGQDSSWLYTHETDTYTSVTLCQVRPGMGAEIVGDIYEGKLTSVLVVVIV